MKIGVSIKTIRARKYVKPNLETTQKQSIKKSVIMFAKIKKTSFVAKCVLVKDFT